MKRLIAISLVIVAALVAPFVVWPVIKEARYARESEHVRNDLKQIMLALHNYHDEHRSFPPAFVVGPDGERWHSWRSLILKDIDPALAKLYRFDEPWNGPNNSKLHKLPPAEFQSDLAETSDSATHYLAIIGKRTVWPADQSVQLRDIGHGTSNTMMLVENRESKICWLAPRDIMGLDAVRMLEREIEATPDRGAWYVTADGSTRRVRHTDSRSGLTSLMTAAWDDLYRGDDWPADLIATAPDTSSRPPRDISDLAATEIHAVPTKTINRNSNHLWCASLQMAWTDLENTLGGSIEFLSPPPAAQQFSRNQLPDNLLSEGSVFHGASNGSRSSDTKLIDKINAKFPDLHYAPQASDNDVALRVVAAIRKKMPFAEEFERLANGLSFRNASENSLVETFGYEPADDQTLPVFANQLSIMDDRGDDDFIIRLKTSGPEKDHIYLAKVPCNDSLQTTWNTIKDRIHSPNPNHLRKQLEARETLKIPVLDFSVFHRFAELEGLVQVNGRTVPIDVVYQDIRLRLDETGADFASIAEVIIGEFGETDSEYNPNRIRNLIFDEPFFLAFQEPDAEEPYFMAWIGNDELMEPMTAPK